MGLAMLLGDLTLFASDSYYYPKERDAVVAIEGVRSRMMDDGKGKCVFKGILVPFTRDWDETKVEHGETKVIPATPDETAAYATLINEKVCVNMEPVKMFSIGIYHKNLLSRLPDGQSFIVYDLYQMKTNNTPRWFSQVLDRIERVAKTDGVAKAFVTTSSIQFSDARILLSGGEIAVNTKPAEEIKPPSERNN